MTGGGVSPWITVIVAAITAVAALGGNLIVTWRQNRRAGREEWFRRVQWAQQLTVATDEDSKRAGYRVLDQLSRSRLAAEDDLELLEQLARNPVIDAALADDAEPLDETPELQDTESTPSEERS